ncbi:thioesterase domain-containing protein [Streptomyces sp. NPDC047718]|uniref:thioesterase domain-containing protein n=1 Tax=Streptomyces sp. NPDC047718 TaxID=3155479 RepID=UPI0033C45E0D
MEAPGRGQLQSLPLIDDCDRLVDYFHTAITPLLDRPFGFFGHTMGALIAYQITRRLHHEGTRSPTGWVCPPTPPHDARLAPRAALT